jgi:hypothetical protein
LNRRVAEPGFAGRTTRRGFVGAAGAIAAGAFAARVSAATAARSTIAKRQAAPAGGGFVSRPDLTPPPITVNIPADGTEAGYLFVAPYDLTATVPVPGKYGPLILDDTGEPVWFLPRPTLTAVNFRVQRYHGRPVLTWYEGEVLDAYGGNYHVYDDTYHELATVKAGNGLLGDLHEFLITSRNTALISIYSQVPHNLSPYGGPVAGQLVIGIVQEIDIPTGNVLFQWSSLDHVPVSESNMSQETKAGNVDYFHLNSIGVDLDGDLLISSRHTSTVYKVDRKTGAVKWRLGGKKSDFEFLPGAAFNYQHDVRRHSDGTLTVFDNGAYGPGLTVEPFTRPIRLSLDMKAMTATLVQEYLPTTPRVAWAMGNLQQLPGGGEVVGWGTVGAFTEFDSLGGVRFDASFADGSVTYRAFRSPWNARPTGRPALAVTTSSDGTQTVYASWNGATEVDSWQVRGGVDPRGLRALRTVPRSGFETTIAIPATVGYVEVAALSASGKQLAVSAPAVL